MANYATDFAALRVKMQERKQRILENMAEGKLDHPEYKRLCGIVQTLDYVVDEINNLALERERADE